MLDSLRGVDGGLSLKRSRVGSATPSPNASTSRCRAKGQRKRRWRGHRHREPQQAPGRGHWPAASRKRVCTVRWMVASSSAGRGVTPGRDRRGGGGPYLRAFLGDAGEIALRVRAQSRHCDRRKLSGALPRRRTSRGRDAVVHSRNQTHGHSTGDQGIAHLDGKPASCMMVIGRPWRQAEQSETSAMVSRRTLAFRT